MIIWCSVRRQSRSTILLVDRLLTEQDPIHRLYYNINWLVLTKLVLSWKA